MTILHPTAIRGCVEAVLISPDRALGLEKSDVAEVRATFAGLEGDCHGGLTRPADVRVRRQYEKDTPIRNTRQASIVSREELEEIAARMEVPEIKPDWLGANLLLSGIPKLTHLPGSTRLIFSSGASLVVDTENAPCRFPAEVIDSHYPGKGPLFVPRATHLRGVTGWVEREGWIRVGDTIAVHLPPQWHYEAPAAKREKEAAA
ncbi:MAG: MOSC domain-containing protein [Parvibaculaceae bacterium]